MIFVFDASAMIAALRGEPGASLVKAILLDQGNRCFAHVVNLCEVFYDFHRSGGPAAAIQAMRDLASAGIVENSEISEAFWQEVATTKAIHRRVSLADCFAVTLANQLGASVLTSDHHEFDALAIKGVCAVRFIR